MATHEGGQKRATRSADDVEDVEATETDTATDSVRERQDKLGDDVDDILDEIDSVLESNAEEFIRSYVQKGGQ